MPSTDEGENVTDAILQEDNLLYCGLGCGFELEGGAEGKIVAAGTDERGTGLMDSEVAVDQA